MHRPTRRGPPTRIDLLAFLIGVLAIIGATIALWSAFGTVPGAALVAVPIALVLLGGLGLFLGHNHK